MFRLLVQLIIRINYIRYDMITGLSVKNFNLFLPRFIHPKISQHMQVMLFDM